MKGYFTTDSEIEEFLLACIFAYPHVLDQIYFDDRYFNDKKLLSLFKKIYQEYGNISLEVAISLAKDKQKAVNRLLDLTTNYVTGESQIPYYYRLLKELYIRNQTNNLVEKLNSQEIDYQTFTTSVEELNDIDIDGKRGLLTTENIVINKVVEREYTNIKELDYLLKGIEYGRLSLWSGVTNCFDEKTEYFNGYKWKYIKDYDGGKVLQYHENGIADLVKPLEFIQKKNQECLEIDCKPINIVATKDHDIVYYTSKGNLNKKKFMDLKMQHDNSKTGFNGKFITTFKYNGYGMNLTDNQLRIMCAVICDGSFRKDRNLCYVRLKRQRKIDRMKGLLKDIQYNISKVYDYTIFSFKAPIRTKVFTKDFYNCNYHQLEIIADEIMNWDGCIQSNTFSSNVKENADFVQFVYSAVGYKATLEVRDRTGQWYKDSHYIRKTKEYSVYVSKRKNTLISIKNPQQKKEILEVGKKDVYCFRVPTGMLVIRRNGKICICGNCGKTSLMIQFAKECLKQHKKIFYFSGEQTSSEFKNYLYVGMCNKEQLEFIKDSHNEKIYDIVPKQQVIEYFDNIYSKDLFIYDNNTFDNTVNNMLKVMRKALREGVRIFFIDNFMQLDNSEKLEEQTRIVELFKRFARDNNVIINLVAHPRKTQFQKSRLTIFDIAGTQNIANKSANICTIMRTDILPDIEKDEIGYLLYRSGYNINRCDGVVEVIKTKGNSCKMVGLMYDKEFKTYRESPKLSESELKTFEIKYAKKNGKRND